MNGEMGFNIPTCLWNLKEKKKSALWEETSFGGALEQLVRFQDFGECRSHLFNIS
jgi:hypothetical protein